VIPDEFNQECIRQLEASNFRNRVAVIGSGPSSPYVAPLKTLMEDLERRCGVAREPDEYFWSYCSRAHAANEIAYYQVLTASYGNSPHWDARAYRHLVAIGFKSYVTFNYDNQLPSTFLDYYPEIFPELFSVYPPPNGQLTASAADFWGPKKRLVAIHGYCDPNNPDWVREIILKAADYDQHYVSHETNHCLFHWWKHLLTTHACVFIGTSLQDPGLSRVVKHLREEQNPRPLELDHIHLKDAPESSELFPSGTTLGMFRQIYFHKLDSRFTGLLRVLSHFSKIPVDNPSPGMLAPSPITATETFQF
jgi:hypothetical protein